MGWVGLGEGLLLERFGILNSRRGGRLGPAFRRKFGRRAFDRCLHCCVVGVFCAWSGRVSVSTIIVESGDILRLKRQGTCIVALGWVVETIRRRLLRLL